MDATSPNAAPLDNGEAAPTVERADLLTGIFGSWPSFHDAEVVRLSLDRRGADGPILEAQIHVFRMTSKVDSRDFYVLQNHTLATLRFTKVTIRAFEDFNHQNVLFALDIARRDPGAIEGLGFEVRMQSSYGLQAWFSCERVIVDAAVPWEPAPSDGSS